MKDISTFPGKVGSKQKTMVYYIVAFHLPLRRQKVFLLAHNANEMED